MLEHIERDEDDKLNEGERNNNGQTEVEDEKNICSNREYSFFYSIVHFYYSLGCIIIKWAI